MDPNTGMDPERERRLMTIQMDDLGTARREYLSTYDEEVLPNATIEQIEATRACNQRGTPEYRFQQANKPTLDAWHNLHVDLGDTGELEDLNPMLGGQTHRLRNIQAAGGLQSVVGSGGRARRARGDNHGVFQNAGRGGGGGAGPNHRAMSTPLPTPHNRRSSTTALDPALDINNDDYSPVRRGRGTSHARRASRMPAGRSRPSRKPFEDTSRPGLRSFSAQQAPLVNLMPTNPADFLRDAHVFSNIGRPRGVSQQPEHRPMPPSSEAPVSPQKPGGKKSTPSQPKKPASGGTRKASQQTEQKALPHSSKAPVNPRKPEEKQVPSNQSKPESKRKQQAQLDKKKLQPAKEQPKSPSAHQSIQSVSQPPGASEGGKGPPPQRPPKAQASSSERKAPKVASVTKAAPTPKAPTGILLDLGDFEPNTPPTIGSIDAIASSLMSPSAQQLEGLEFLEGVKTKKQYIDELIDQYDGQLIDEQTGQPLSKAQFAAALRHAFGNVNVREPTSQEPVHAHAQILQPETPVKEQSHRGGPHTPVSSPRALSNGSFSEYRSPANISSSGDEAAGYAVDDNLSPKKSSPEHLAPQLELLSISDPLPGLGSKRHRSGSSSDIGPSKSGKLPSRLSDIGSREREGLTKRILSEEILSKIPSKLRSHEGKRHQIGFESSSTGKTAKLVLECRKDKKKKVWSQRLGVDKTRAAGTPEPIRVRSTTPGRADEAVSLLDEMKPLDTMMGQYKAKHKEIISSISGDDASSVSTTGKLDVAVHTPPRSKLDPSSGSPSMRLARVRNVFAVGETLEKYREAHKNLVSSGTSETVPEGHRASTAAHSSLDMNLEPVLSRRSGNEVTGGQLERFEDFMKRHISASTISEKQPSPAPPTPLTLGVQSIDRGNFDMAPMNDPMEIDFITKPNSRAQSRAITPGLQTSIYATDSGRESAKPSVTPTKRTSMGTMGTNPITEVLHTPAFEVPVSVDPAFVERLVETQAKIMEKLTNTAEIKGPNVFDTQLGMGPSMGKKAKPTAPETGTDTPKWPTVLGVPSGMRPTMEKLMKAADPDTNAEKPKGPFAVSFQSGPRRPPMDTKITPAGTGAEQPKILTVLGVQSGMCHSSMDTKVKSTDADDDKPKRPMVLGPRPYLPNRGL